MYAPAKMLSFSMPCESLISSLTIIWTRISSSTCWPTTNKPFWIVNDFQWPSHSWNSRARSVLGWLLCRDHWPKNWAQVILLRSQVACEGMIDENNFIVFHSTDLFSTFALSFSWWRISAANGLLRGRSESTHLQQRDPPDWRRRTWWGRRCQSTGDIQFSASCSFTLPQSL